MLFLLLLNKSQHTQGDNTDIFIHFIHNLYTEKKAAVSEHRTRNLAITSPMHYLCTHIEDTVGFAITEYLFFKNDCLGILTIFYDCTKGLMKIKLNLQISA